MKLKHFTILFSATILALATAACSNATEQPATNVTAAATTAITEQSPVNATSAATTAQESVKDLSSEYQSAQTHPLELQHAFGTTIIEQKPERVVTIAWANQDTPLALGIVPVGFSMANFGPVDTYGMHSWTSAKVADLGEESPNVFSDTDGIDYEAINEANPDVILAAYSGLTQEEYELLSKIAPVVAYPINPWQTYWREQIVLNATGMGLKEKGEKYVADMDALIAEEKAKYPQLQDKTGAFLWIDATNLSSFYLYFPIDTRAAYLTDLGLTFPEDLNALKTDEVSFAASVSAENIDVLNGLDIIVAYGDATLLQVLQADPLFGTVPAIQRGSVVLIDSNTDLAGAATPSALSIPAIIGEYMQLLAEAADKVKL